MSPEEREWVSFSRDSWPREWGLKRVPVFSLRHFLTLCRIARNSRRSGYLSVYSADEIEACLVPVLFYDLDAKGDMEGLVDALSRMIDSMRSLKCRVYYTGGRGFHVYVYVDPPVAVDRDRLRDAAETVFFELLGGARAEDYVDRHCMGDWRRMARVPYTFHESTGREMVPVYVSTGSCEPVREVLLEHPPRREEPKPKATAPWVSLDAEGYPPCIRAALRDLRESGELSHERRLHLASFLLRAGVPIETVVSLFTMASDFNERVTRYQVEYLARNRYLPFCCRKARLKGICPLENQALCPFYPSINSALGWKK